MKARNEAEGNDLQENYEHFCEIFNALKPLENAKDSGMEKFNLNNPRVQVKYRMASFSILKACNQIN